MPKAAKGARTHWPMSTGTTRSTEFQNIRR